MSDFSDRHPQQGASPLVTSFLVFALVLLLLGGSFAAWTLYARREAARAVALEAQARAKMEAYQVDPKTGKLSEAGDPSEQDTDSLDIGEFELTERSGKTVTNKDLLGRPWAVCFVFTRCAGQCLEITNNMKDLERELGGAPVRLVTITVDPKFDTPEVLRNYADNFGADPEGWLFLTGEQEYVYRLLRGYFRQTVQELTGEDRQKGFEIVHTSNVLHIDAQGKIVKKYNGMNPAEMTQLRRALLEEAEQLAKNPAAEQPAVAEKPASPREER